MFYTDGHRLSVPKANNIEKLAYFCKMKFLRKKIVSLIFLSLTGILFLNMSFFLAEISLLKSAYSHSTIENIAKLLSASLTEEEQDVSESSESKAIDLSSDHFSHLVFEDNGIAIILRMHGLHSMPHGGFFKIFTPPPDLC
jgi:hypothetical protein